MTTLLELLRNARQRLEAAAVPDARLEAELLLSHYLRLPRHRLYAYQNDEASPDALAPLNEALARRERREPLAYIIGSWPFYGVEITVGPEALAPRPETETLVERTLLACLERMESQPSLTVADVGTGSGCIAVALAMHLPRARVFASDISPQALSLAAENVRRHGLGERATLVESDLLERIAPPLDVIVANLPYIPAARLPTLQPELAWEPELALNGGPDGLSTLRRLMGQAAGALAANGVMLLEIDPGLAAPLCRLANRLFPDAASVTIEPDLAGLDRMLVVDCAEPNEWPG